jgi:HAE1 family hydrophobic/amphiphilic exporter-1
MTISLFDALTVAPFLSAYFAGSGHKSNNFFVRKFDKFQDWLDKIYVSVVSFCINKPLLIIAITIGVFLLSITALGYVKKTFQPSPEAGEFSITVKMPSGTSLAGTKDTGMQIAERIIKNFPELHHMTVQIGNDQGEADKAAMGVFMVHKSKRKRSSGELKAALREMMKEYAFAEPAVDDYVRDSTGISMKPFILNIKGENLDELYEYSNKVIERLKKISDITDITTSVQAGKPEFQVKFDDQKLQMFGVSQKVAGMELRYHIEGGVVGKLHDRGLEYDVRMRLRPEQRDLMSSYNETRVPNMMFKMIPLSALSSVETAKGPANILRQERARVVQIMANTSVNGALGSALSRAIDVMEKQVPKPEGVTYAFVGQAETYNEMVVNMSIAFILALIFIYLVLSSLYESFITPITILLAIPPAISGAYLALFVTGQMLDLFGWIGIVVLIGLVTKNSILLVDFALEGIRSGLSRKEAIKQAGVIRLRPILMTTFAMIAGMAPMALGIGEAAKFRQSMGIAIMGGIVISTLITLLVVPSVFEYIDIFREFIESKFRPEGIEKIHCELSEMQKDIAEECKIEAEKEKKSVKPVKKIKSALKGKIHQA